MKKQFFINGLASKEIKHSNKPCYKNSLRMTILADLKSSNDCTQTYMILSNIKLFVQTKNGSKPMYLNISEVKPRGKDKWARYFEVSDKQYKTIYNHPFLVSKDSKLQWFQYQNHHILTTTFNCLMYKQVKHIKMNVLFVKKRKNQFIIDIRMTHCSQMFRTTLQ